jgi:hypothetical protein
VWTIDRLNNYRISPPSVIRITKWILKGKVEIVLNVSEKKGKHERIPVRLRRSTEITGPETTEILPGMISEPSFYNLQWLDRGVSLNWIGSKERSLVERLCDDPQGNDSRCQGDSQAAATLR